MFKQNLKKKKITICQGRQPPTEKKIKRNVFPTNLVADSYYFYVLIAIYHWRLLHSTVFLDELTTCRFFFLFLTSLLFFRL